MDLSASVERQSDAIIVHVRGELDIVSAPVLRQVFIEVLSETPAAHLIVDLSDVSFIDSTGIGVIVGAYKRVRTKGGRFNAVVTTTEVRRALTMTGLMRIWRATASVEEALEG